APLLLLRGGLVLFRDRLARFDHGGAFPWVLALRNDGELTIPKGHEDQALTTILAMPRVPRLALPDALRFEEIVAEPRPRVRILSGVDRLRAELAFDYAGSVVRADAPVGVVVVKPRKLIRRDFARESACAALVQSLGFKPKNHRDDRDSQW